jgi:hypothetical protein
MLCGGIQKIIGRERLRFLPVETMKFFRSFPLCLAEYFSLEPL